MATAARIEVRRFATKDDLQSALIERLAAAVGAPPCAEGSAIMLSGGNTPLPAYRELAARNPRPTSGLRVLFSDDRYVPSTANASNYHQILPLLTALRLPDDSVLRVRTELPLDQAANDFERRLDTLVHAKAHFGLGLLGLGADGHTASLFGAADIERSKGRRAIAVNRPDGMQAVSVTPEVITWFDELIFIVAGADKHDAVQALLSGDDRIAASRAIADRQRSEIWMAEV
ncbi:MAG TPA: 6-phosphogluconolactonase [Steroidobacteraceae bacterium]|jgi:6-phosphogluconolactonase